jgi:alkaline phosphatase D
VGRTRTFPAPQALASQLRFAYASCQRFETGHFSAYTHMAREQLDAVVFLGDYIYEYNSRGASTVRHLPGYLPAFADTVEGYRMRYAAYKSDASLQAMHAQCPWIVTWDDHEVYNDYAANQGEDLSPNFMQRKAAAYQAFYEHMPLRASTLIAGIDSLKTNGELRIYGAFNAGKLANFLVLDDRQYRDNQACPKPGRGGGGVVRAEECAELFDPKRTLLGASQEAWLDQALSKTSAQWNIIAQQTLVCRRNYSPSDKASKALLHSDNWDGYPAARQRMLAGIQAHSPSNPVFVGGDIHQNWVGHIKADFTKPNSKTIATEFCGTSITSGGGANDDKFKDRLANNPHFVFADAEQRGYGVVELTPKRLTTTLRVIDDVRLKQTQVNTLAVFNVESGSNTIQR